MVQHWTNLYRRLASFDHTMRRLKRHLRDLSGEARGRAAKLAIPALIADAEACGRRFDFWEARLTQLR